MKEDEKSWFEPLRANVTEAVTTEGEKTAATDAAEGNEEPLVLLLRTDSLLSFLRSRTAVERLARECVGRDSVHLIMLGG